MSDELSQYLKAHGGRPLQSTKLKSYVATMTDTVIPQIARDVQAREQLAAELRYTPQNSARKAKAED